MEFDKEFLDKLFEQAMENPRLRQNFDLRTSCRWIGTLVSGNNAFSIR